jgi:hypothetical protein
LCEESVLVRDLLVFACQEFGPIRDFRTHGY